MSTPTGTPKRVAKVTVEAPVVSFRYPHFLIGRQPTFDMPPPSTIFGHVASALGHWPRQPLRFAYAFRKRSRAQDLEHQHIIQRAKGKFPGNVPDPLWRPPEPTKGKKLTKKQLEPAVLQKSTEATVQPHTRDFLFDVTLELYLDPPELADAFRSPVFTVVLGRSQDLASVRRVEVVDLEFADIGYVEHTILPGRLRRQLPWGVTTLMPRYIGPPPERNPSFEPYIVLQDRIYVGAAAKGARGFLKIEGEEPLEWFADRGTPDDRGGRRLLWFHTLDPAEFGDVSV
jgi:CRISPR-associated protein Cas5t